jgi:gamma-glutamylcyclotransferase (GGCT)/AIG2-like uncharacterized protein YtfP
MNLYFAYGSNMDQKQMNERCPGAELVGVASLKDYKLAFTIYSPIRKCGCADVVASPGDVVYGLLYKLSDDELKKMDDFEGHPIHYRRIEVRISTKNGEVPAYTYEVVTKQTGLVPSKEYLALLTGAAHKYQFPLPYQK